MTADNILSVAVLYSNHEASRLKLAMGSAVALLVWLRAKVILLFYRHFTDLNGE